MTPKEPTEEIVITTIVTKKGRTPKYTSIHDYENRGTPTTIIKKQNIAAPAPVAEIPAETEAPVETTIEKQIPQQPVKRQYTKNPDVPHGRPKKETSAPAPTGTPDTTVLAAPATPAPAENFAEMTLPQLQESVQHYTSAGQQIPDDLQLELDIKLEEENKAAKNSAALHAAAGKTFDPNIAAAQIIPVSGKRKNVVINGQTVLREKAGLAASLEMEKRILAISYKSAVNPAERQLRLFHPDGREFKDLTGRTPWKFRNGQITFTNGDMQILRLGESKKTFSLTFEKEMNRAADRQPAAESANSTTYPTAHRTASTTPAAQPRNASEYNIDHSTGSVFINDKRVIMVHKIFSVQLYLDMRLLDIWSIPKNSRERYHVLFLPDSSFFPTTHGLWITDIKRTDLGVELKLQNGVTQTVNDKTAAIQTMAKRYFIRKK